MFEIDSYSSSFTLPFAWYGVMQVTALQIGDFEVHRGKALNIWK